MKETYRITAFNATSETDDSVQAQIIVDGVPTEITDEMVRIDVSGSTHYASIALPTFVLTQLMARVMQIKEQRKGLIVPPAGIIIP